MGIWYPYVKPGPFDPAKEYCLRVKLPIAGAGKTFLRYFPHAPYPSKFRLLNGNYNSSVVIDHLLEQQLTNNYGVAYVYFDYKEQDRQMPSHILASLLKQLFGQVEVTSAEVETLYNNIERGRRPTFGELYTTFLVVSKLFDRVFLIFDALDECSQKQRRKLLPLFHDLGKNGISVFLTSRQYPEDIQSSLRNSPKIELSAKKEDIEIYIQQKIDENERAQSLVGDGDLRARIVSSLVDCAQGMFLLIHFHLEHLCQQTTIRQILAELDRLQSASAFIEERPLDPTYDRAMGKLRGQTKRRTDLALKILSWLVKAKRTLTVDELQAAVSIVPNQYYIDQLDVPDKTILLDVCASLVIIDEKSNTIRLAHYTVQEYLLRSSIVFENAQITVALACTTFLSFDIFDTPSGDPRPQPNLRVQRFNQRITRPTLRFRQERELWGRFKSYPLLRYVARYLSPHLKECEDSRLTNAILKLLQSPGNLSSYFDAVYAQSPLGEFDYFVYRDNQPLFHAACALGYLPVVKLLLDSRVDLSARDINGRTALLEAASWGCEQVSRVLIESGAKISALDTNGQNALHLAASNGHDCVVRLLLEEGAEPSTPDQNRLTPLHHSAFKGSEEVVRLLIEKGADPLVLDIDGKTALHRAAFQGHEGVVRSLLEKGMPVGADTPDGTGSTPLHLSTCEGHGTVTKLLLNGGAKIFLEDSMGQTALHRAASRGHNDIIQLLLGEGFNLKRLDISKQDQMGMTALHYSAQKGSKMAVRLLIENGANPFVLANNGRNALHLSASKGHCSVVKFLLKKGMDISAPDNTGSTPLHLSIFGGHRSVALLLLHKSPDLSSIDKHGRTPLHIATFKEDIEMIRLLLENGADFLFVDYNGRNLLHLLTIHYKLSSREELIRAEYKPLIQLLLDNGVGISTRDKNGWTALHHAVSGFLGARDNHPGLELLKVLLEKGADHSVKGTDGKTALHVAASAWNSGAVSILIKNGANPLVLDINGQTPLDLALQDKYQWVPFQNQYSTIQLLLENGNQSYQGIYVLEDVPVKPSIIQMRFGVELVSILILKYTYNVIKLLTIT